MRFNETGEKKAAALTLMSSAAAFLRKCINMCLYGTPGTVRVSYQGLLRGPSQPVSQEGYSL